MRAAKVEAVKYWRTRKNSIVNDCPDENPFKGLKAAPMYPDDGQSWEEFELQMEQLQKEAKTQ